MKKNEKIMIGILVLILLVVTAILVLTKIKVRKQDICIERDNPASSNEINNLENSSKEVGRIVKVNGKLYYDTGKSCDETAEVQRCGTMDGNITSVIAAGEIPTEDGQANFTGAKGYQYGSKENTIDIPLENEGWIVFETKSYESLDKYKEYDKITTLRSKTASTEILIRFNGILYGKSFSVIDYVGGSERIGTIDKLIDSKYVPKFDGETNNKEILGASVFEASEKNIVLNYNNTYVLFEKI